MNDGVAILARSPMLLRGDGALSDAPRRIMVTSEAKVSGVTRFASTPTWNAIFASAKSHRVAQSAQVADEPVQALRRLVLACVLRGVVLDIANQVVVASWNVERKENNRAFIR